MFTGIIAEQGKVLSVERNGDSSATVRLLEAAGADIGGKELHFSQLQRNPSKPSFIT